ncbi:MAG: PDZ domain-containing protein [Chloroflexota bacterium]|nr:PDZ domain-containing protein [Chloroflexota bacterium]
MPYETKDVGADYPAAMEMIRRSGQQGVPVIATEDEVILGFDQVRLAKLAEKYAGPKRPPLGVLAADAEEYLARHPEKAEAIPPGTKGVFVGKIRPETVAERAGLLPGDVIVGLAGKRVRSMGQLDQLVGTLKAGDAVPVRYLREGSESTATLQF